MFNSNCIAVDDMVCAYLPNIHTSIRTGMMPHVQVTRVRRKPTGIPPDDEEPIKGSAMGTDKCPHDFAGIGAMVSALV